MSETSRWPVWCLQLQPPARCGILVEGHCFISTLRHLSITSPAGYSCRCSWLVIKYDVCAGFWRLASDRPISAAAENRCAHDLTRRKSRFVPVRHARTAQSHFITAMMPGGTTATEAVNHRTAKTNKQNQRLWSATTYRLNNHSTLTTIVASGIYRRPWFKLDVRQLQNLTWKLIYSTCSLLDTLIKHWAGTCQLFWPCR